MTDPRTDARLAPYGIALLRISMGVMFLAHGFLLKVLTFGPAGTAGYFASIGYPAALAYVVIIAETLAGVALIFGVWTRLVALLALPIMLGALLQHLPNGWVFSAAKGGWEFPAFWSVALVAQAMLGSGALALGDLRRFLSGRRVAAA